MDARGRGRLYIEPQTIDMTLQAALTPALSARLVNARRVAFATDGRGRTLVPLRVSGPVARPAVNIDAPKVVAKRSASSAPAVAAAPKTSARRNPSLFERIFGTTQ
jgi:hypothetical protein